MKKGKVILALTVLSLLIVMVLASCGPAPTQAPTATPTPTASPKPTGTTAPSPSPTASPKPTATPAPTGTKNYSLVFASYNTPNYKISEATTRYMDAIEKATNGQVKFQRYWSATLFRQEQLLDAFTTNQIDLTIGGANLWTATIPILDAFYIPFAYKDESHAQRALRNPELTGIFNKYMSKYNMVFVAYPTWGFAQFGSNKAMPKLPSDMKGQKIRAGMAIMGRYIELAGGAPVYLSSSEMYMALQTGTINGVATPIETYVARKLPEVIKYIAVSNFDANPGTWIFNNTTWNSLPQNLRDIILQVGKAEEDRLLKDTEDSATSSLNDMKAKGVEVYYLTPQEIAEWAKLAPTIENEWKTKTGADGERALQIIQQAAK